MRIGSSFRPNTTYGNFAGSLTPIQENTSNQGALGFRFAPKPGFLMDAAARVYEDRRGITCCTSTKSIEPIWEKFSEKRSILFEPDPESPCEVTLAYDLGEPSLQKLRLPNNLHVLCTMNVSPNQILG
jgi:hypothetical protein